MTNTTFGKIYSYPNNPRVWKSLVAAKYNGLSVEVVPVTFSVDNATPEFLAKFPFGKYPVFESPDGFTLYESTAIAQYVAHGKENTSLFGENQKDAAVVQQFLSIADLEFGPIFAAWVYPILGYSPVNVAATEKAKNDCKRALAALNSHLKTRTFLVTERVTLADIAMVCNLIQLFKSVFEPAFVASYKNVIRWFTTCINQPQFKEVIGEVIFCEKMQVAVAKVVEKKEKAPKAAKVAKPAAEEEEEDLEAIAAAEEAPKEKNPLDLLPKSSLNMDEWKRFYSNNETRPTAVNWFWENYDAAGYSIWKCEYKYGKELAQIFMSSNLVGGFFQRLDRARKYAFGSLLIVGTDNDNQITGHFMFRGHAVPFEVTDAADYESYTFTRINDQDPKEREAFNSSIAWDATINGKPMADGKVFK